MVLWMTTSPGEVFQSQCGNILITDGSIPPTQYIDTCQVLEGCYSNPSTSVWDSASTTLGLDILNVTELQTALDQSGLQTPLSPSPAQVQANLDSVDTVGSISITAASLNIPSPSPPATLIDAKISDLEASALCMSNSLTPLVATYTSLETARASVVTSASAMIAAISPEQLEELLSCEWLRDQTFAFTAALFHGPPRDGIAMAGLMVLLTGLLCFGIVFTQIALQIRCGNVGRFPGCPQYCRCCCNENHKTNIEA